MAIETKEKVILKVLYVTPEDHEFFQWYAKKQGRSMTQQFRQEMISISNRLNKGNDNIGEENSSSPVEGSHIVDIPK